MMYHHAKFGCKCKRSLEDPAETFIFWLNELSLSHWDLDPRDTKPNYVEALPGQIWLQKVEFTKYHPDKTGHRYNTPTPFHNFIMRVWKVTPTSVHLCATWTPSVGSQSWWRDHWSPPWGWTRWSLSEWHHSLPAWQWAPYTHCTGPLCPWPHAPDTWQQLDTYEVTNKNTQIFNFSNVKNLTVIPTVCWFCELLPSRRITEWIFWT